MSDEDHVQVERKHTVEARTEDEVEIIDEPDQGGQLPHKDPEDAELKWYKEVYQGDQAPQFTPRAIVMGMILGCFMSLSNLYVGLKTGWALGVAITACILSFAIWKALRTALPALFKTDMHILESNCMQTTASSAGYSTGGTMVSAIAAYLIVGNPHMGWVTLTLWTIFLAALGVFIAIPLKRQMINIEQLKFPSGIAAAETLKSLHATGEGAGQARSLAVAGAFGALVAWFRDAGKPFALPSQLPFPGTLAGFPLAKWTISFELSGIMIAAGAIMGWKVCWSMMLGGFINYAYLAPKMAALGAIDTGNLGYRSIMQWSTWAGAALMVTSGLLTFALQWKTVIRAFGGITDIFHKRTDSPRDPLAHVEVPAWWFLAGTAASGLGCMAVLHYAFGTSWALGFVAVVLTFFLALVAARATGETDITPMGAMGKITQLTFGVLAPTNITTNLMTASVTGGAASASADLLTGLKTGYLLGANPRKQFLSQFIGIFAGTAIVVPAFYLLVPDASVLGTDKWPAPSAQVWAAVAKLLANGIDSLHPAARVGLLAGGLVGIVIPLIELAFPKHRKYIPSAMGLGLSMVIPFFNSLSMFIGALITLVLEKKAQKIADDYVIPVASGVIAGESIMGIAVALLSAMGILK